MTLKNPMELHYKYTKDETSESECKKKKLIFLSLKKLLVIQANMPFLSVHSQISNTIIMYMISFAEKFSHNVSLYGKSFEVNG